MNAATKKSALIPTETTTGHLPVPESAAVRDGERRLVPWLNIEKSKFNPRKSFNADKVAELAASIADQGVQQNLVVRPHPTSKDAFEIVAGETRYRAIELLIKQGRVTPAFEVPVLVRPLTDAEVIAAALTENMQRQDLTPMEEAEALKALEATGLTTADIAARIGFTVRYVQQRLALAKNLAPEAREALEAGEINIEAARIIATASADRQAEILKKGAHALDDADDLRILVKGNQIPENHAIFPITDYQGAWLPGEKDGERLFADTVQFMKLQKAAVAARKKQLEAKGAAWVKITPEFKAWQFEEKPNAKNAGVVIELRADGKVTLHTGLVEKARQVHSGTPTPVAKEKDPREAFSGDHWDHADRLQIAAIQRAVAADPGAALRVICLSAISSESTFSPGQVGTLDAQVAKNVAAALDKAGLRKGIVIEPKGGFGVPYSYSETDDTRRAKIKALWKMTDIQIGNLVTLLVAANTGEYSAYRGCSTVACGIAEQLGIAGKEEKHGLALQPKDLDGLNDSAIRAVARDLKIDQWLLSTVATLRAAILAAIKAGKAKNYVLPTLRFTPSTEISKVLTAWLKGTDGEPAKPAAAAKKATAKKSAPKAKAKKKAAKK